MLEKKIFKNTNYEKDYRNTAIWCTNNNAHIEDKGEYFEVIINTEHTPTIQEQILVLEGQQTPRLLRNAALGEQYAINKLQEIESSIANLRGQIK